MRQPASFWCISLYIFFEYVRPQSIYLWLPQIPYNKIALIGAAVFAVAEGKKIRWGAVETLLMVFLAVVLISSTMAVFPTVSFDRLSEYTNWVFIYFLVANAVETEGRFIVFVLFFMIWNFKMSAHGTKSWAADGFAFRDWGTGGAPGFFENSGEFGIEMVIFSSMLLPWIVGLRPYWGKWKLYFWVGIGVTAVCGLVGSSSRGALIALAVVALMRLSQAKYKWRTLIGIVVVSGFVWFLMPAEAKERYTTIGQDETSLQRKQLWKEGIAMIQAYPTFGIGYRNWIAYHTFKFPDEQHLVPHNIFIECGAELGYAGLFAFVALIGANFVLNYRTRKMLKGRANGRFMYLMTQGLDGALVGYLTAAMFVTVFYYPFFWINLALSAALHNAAIHSIETTSAPPPPLVRRPTTAQARARLA
ncbi:MAG TPA: O-antigen ligase family protein [Gemmatimonadaceae bacterium]